MEPGFRRSGRADARVLLALALCALAPEVAHAQTTGTIAGTVTEKDGKTPVPLAQIALMGTARGTMGEDDGRFVIRDVPAGPRTLKIMEMGHPDEVRDVLVKAGETTYVKIRMGESKTVKTFDTITVIGHPLIDTHNSQNNHPIDSGTLTQIPVDKVIDAAALKAGVVSQAGQLHVRGGRSDELKERFNGIEVSDPSNGALPEISNSFVASANLITGGVDAKYGNALSGILEVETREGGPHFGGEMQWHTDRYGETVKTFDNYDRLTAGFGGPTPVRDLTWFATFDGTWQDTYLKNGMSESRHNFLDFIRLGNRQSNGMNSGFKLAYTHPKWKWTVEGIDNRSITTPYDHMWSRNGYVSVTADSTTPGTPRPVYGRWSFFPEDSTYQPYNAADHLPTTTSEFRQVTTLWRQNLNPKESYTIRLARNEFLDHTAVAGKEPWEYDTRPPFYWSGNESDNQYYATHGDYPVWSDRQTVVYTARGDYVSNHWKDHLIEAGVELRRNSLRNVSLVFPNQEAQGLPGLQRTDYDNSNPEASAYVQDRWEYEGLVLNAGLHWDGYTPGAQIPAADLFDPRTGRPVARFKQQVSPRLGVAYPISDRDVLSLHYGWLYQIPNRDFLFENRGSQATVPIRGNPNLEAQTNIEYQAAVQHLFSRDVAGQFAVFFRDIYGLINTRQVRDPATNLLVNTYVNEDYASARGFEASVTKRLSHRFATDLNYTYSIATGVASNPNDGLQFANGTQLYLPISEQPLIWDQRHTLSASLVMRDPGRWGGSLLWTFGSGLPYTPAFRDDRKPDPMLTNSRRLPSQSTLSIMVDKFFRVWAQRVTLFADARNVLNAKNISSLTFGGFPNPFINQVGDEYLIYYTETGRPGGAYLKDTNGDGKEDWVPLHDPRVWQEGRSIRVGVGMSFGR
jgi:TonB-dependent receptor-like protein/carboxypeptidase-like protein